MAKAYWISNYLRVTDPNKFAAYAMLAGPALEAAGGRFLVRGTAAHAYEAGLLARCVVIEFGSLEQARLAHESPAYQAALAALDGGAVRDLRLVEGL